VRVIFLYSTYEYLKLFFEILKRQDKYNTNKHRLNVKLNRDIKIDINPTINMDSKTFQKQIQQDEEFQDAFVNTVHDEFAEYCIKHGITEEQISPEELMKIAEEFIQNGLST